MTAPPGQARASQLELPYLIVVATGEFPGIGQAQVVFDTLTLSAQQRARYAEVREVLDLAVATQKAFYSEKRAPFTVRQVPASAISSLLTLEPKHALEQASRHRFFALLSAIPEADIMTALA